MTAVTRPVLRYHGGKFKIAPRILKHFPPHRVYVEPFGGAASVLMRNPRSDFEVYNDLDGDVVNVFRVLRDPTQAAELQRLLKLTPWARAEFEAAYEPSDDPVEHARRTIVRCFMGHGTTSRRKNRTGFRAGSHPHRTGGGFGDWLGYHEAIPAFVDRLHGVVIEHRDGLELLARHDAPDTLFYVDPPYPEGTRTSIRGPGDNDRCYRADMIDDDDHCRLAPALCELEAAVVVSGYPCALYDQELYQGWERHAFRAMADHGAERVEAIWIKPAGVRMPRPRSFVHSSLLDSMAPDHG
ncbi:MAG TPA: DNA adenine methylase [Stellaceae bacterium]|nr:DNA adenine methylase [Stellaceae bacterium]